MERPSKEEINKVLQGIVGFVREQNQLKEDKRDIKYHYMIDEELFRTDFIKFLRSDIQINILNHILQRVTVSILEEEQSDD